jgi:hydrogenase maturation protease
MATPPSVLALAGIPGDSPGRLLLTGVQPVKLDTFGGGLRPSVKRQIEPAIGMVLDCLARRGITPFSAWRRGKRQ